MTENVLGLASLDHATNRFVAAAEHRPEEWSETLDRLLRDHYSKGTPDDGSNAPYVTVWGGMLSMLVKYRARSDRPLSLTHDDAKFIGLLTALGCSPDLPLPGLPEPWRWKAAEDEEYLTRDWLVRTLQERSDDSFTWWKQLVEESWRLLDTRTRGWDSPRADSEQVINVVTTNVVSVSANVEVSDRDRDDLTLNSVAETPPVVITDASTLMETALSALKSCERLAWDQYKRALDQKPSLMGSNDAVAYEWFNENLRDPEEDGPLPALKTWSRYVSAGRKATGQQKNKRRSGRASGNSVVSATNL